MMKFLIVLLALVAIACANLDVIPHYSHKGGHGISSRYFKKAQGHGYGLGYGGYGMGYGGYGLGYGGYGAGGYGLGARGYGLGVEGYGLGAAGYGLGDGAYGLGLDGIGYDQYLL